MRTFVFLKHLSVRFVGVTGTLCKVLPALFLSSCMNASLEEIIPSIADDGLAQKVTVDLDITSLSLSEGSSAIINVTLSDRRATPTVVQVAMTSPRNDTTLDFMPVTATVTVPAKSLSAALVLVTQQDTLYEKSEDFTLTIATADPDVTVEHSAFTITIQDDELPPRANFSSATQNINEGAGTGTATVILNRASVLPITIPYTTAAISASGADYTWTSGNVTFNPGETSKTINFTVSEDSDVEGAETFSATLGVGTSEVTLGTTSTHTVTIVDNDLTSLVINDATVTEGGSLVFTVTLSAASGAPVTFDWATSAGSATAGTHYNNTSGSVTVNPGDLTATITVPTLNATGVCDTDKTLNVTLSNPMGASITDGTGVGTISDDDVPTLSLANNSGTEGSNVSITATITPVCPTKTVSFSWSNAAGTATAADDYAVITGQSASIAAGSTTVSLDTVTIADGQDELNETFTVSASGLTNAVAGTTTATATILDNDASPSLTISDVTVAEGGVANFTVTLSATSNLPVTFNWASSDGTAAAGSDYTAGTGTAVSIPAGSTTASISVNTTQDTLNETNETFTVTISSPTNASISDASGVVTITDDDSAPSLSINNISVDESTTLANMTVSLSTASGQAITFNWSSANGTATAGADYTASSGTAVTIPAGSTSTTISVPITDDTSDEPDETFTVTIASPTNATIGTATGTVTITDNDSLPTVTFTASTQTASEAAGTVTFTAQTSVVSGNDITIPYTISGTASAAGVDHDLAAGTLTITAGQTTASATFNVTDDALDEDDETVVASIGTVTNGVLGSPSTHTVTITDNDAMPVLTIDDVTVNESTGTASFTVTLSPVSGRSVSVDWATSNDTATAGADYTAGTGTLTFSAGQTSKMITVTVADDTLDENNETLDVTLSTAVNATISDNVGVLTIQDNDLPPTIEFALASSTVAESVGGVTITANLSTASGLNVSVPFSISGTSSSSDHNLTNGTISISAGATTGTVSFSITDDSVDENDETLILAMGSPTNATVGTNSSHTLTITDNDDAPGLSINDLTVNESAGTATFTVTLASVSEKNVTFDYYTSAATATAAADYTAITTTAGAINAGATTASITVSILEDTTDEYDETFNVVLTNAANATINDNTGVGTITDNDAAPSLSINDITVNENAGTATLTATLSAVSGKTITFEWATATGTAASPGDYTAVTTTQASIAAGATTVSLNITIINDSTDEYDEDFTANLTNPADVTISDGQGTVTIADDDSAPAITINDIAVNENAGTATFTVSLSAASAKAISVDWASANGTATQPGDYTQGSGTLNFSAGTTSQNITVTIQEDTLDEDNETYSIGLTNAVNASIADNTGVGTINDNDNAPNVQFTLTSSTLAEQAGADAVITIQLSALSGKEVTVPFTITGTASGSGVDYTAATSSPVTIPAGSSSVTVNITPVNDTDVEVSETIILTIDTPTNASIGTNGVHTITLTNDDWPIVTFSSTSSSINESAGFLDTWPSAMQPWGSRKKLQFYNSAASEAVTDMPVMVRLNSSRIDFAKTQNSGQDIRFTDSNHNNLYYEIEKWNEAGNEAIVWVRVPSIPASNNGYIWMYYNNASASDAQNVAQTWNDSKHKGVWHLNGDAVDSAAANNGSVTGTVGTITGVAAQGRSFPGTASNNISSPTTTNYDFGTSDFTVSTWVKRSAFATSQTFVSRLNASTGFQLISDNNDMSAIKLLRGPTLTAGTASNSGALPLDTDWHHITATISSGTVYYFVDGVAVGSGAPPATSATVATTVLRFGEKTAGSAANLNGQMDEVRLSSGTYTASYIKANFLSQADRFVSFRAEELASNQLTLTINLDRVSPFTTTIPFIPSGTATGGVDYDSLPTNIVIAAGDTSGSIKVRVFKDTLDAEGNETLVVTLGTPTNGELGTDIVHTLTIQDDPNVAPVSSNDSFNITSATSYTTLSVAANDTDANSDILSVTAMTNPTSGTVFTNGSEIFYKPNLPFSGSDSFTYTISDGRGGTSTSTVTLTMQIPFTWVGTMNNDFNTASNWIGGAVPTTGNPAYFNNQCTNCSPTLSANKTVDHAYLDSSFSGSLNTSTFTLTLGTSGSALSHGLTMRGGTLNASTGTLTIYGNTNVTGGTFSASSGTTTMYINYSHNIFDFRPSILTHNSGTVRLYGASTLTTSNARMSGAAFYNLHLGGTTQLNFLAGSTATVENNLTHTNGSKHEEINDLTINLKKDLILAGAGRTTGSIRGTIKVIFNANSGSQVISQTCSTTPCDVPSVEFNSASAITIGADLSFNRDFTYISALSVTPPATTTFIPYSANFTANIAANGMTFSGVDFRGAGLIKFQLLNQMNVAGNVTITTSSCGGGTRFRFDGSSVNFTGDLETIGCGTQNGDTVFNMVGNTAATIRNTVSTDSPRLPILNIAKDPGTNVSIDGNFYITQNFTHTSGTVIPGTSAATIGTGSYGQCNSGITVSTTGGLKFYDATINMICGSTITTTMTGNIEVSNILQMNYGQAQYLNGDKIVHTGPTLYYSGANGATYGYNGNLAIELNGATPVTMSCPSSCDVNKRHLPGNLIVNKSGSTVTMGSAFKIDGASRNLTVQAGTLLMSGYNATVGGAVTINSGATITRGGGTLSYGSLVNNGTLNP